MKSRQHVFHWWWNLEWRFLFFTSKTPRGRD